MAFADAVTKGMKRVDDCPHVSGELAAELGSSIGERESIEKEQERLLERLRAEVSKLDFGAAAERLGTALAGGRLPINSLGKEFFVDARGEVISECHTAIPWLAIPMLAYVLNSGGKEPEGKWAPFEELPGGGKWARLFGQRCEKEFKDLADSHPDLFGDITAIFSGSASAGDITADVSLELEPLPRLPVLICYWRQDGDFESKLKLYFDRTAEENLDIVSIYTLCVGLVTMFGKIASRHR